MKRAGYIFIALFLVCTFKTDLTVASLPDSLVYRSYAEEKSRKQAIDETFIEFKDLPNDQTRINRKKQGKRCLVNDEFIIDRDYSLLTWKRSCSEDNTDIIAQRGEGVLHVKGTLKGEAIDKEIELGTKYLHVYPKYSLSKFAMSNVPKMKFWTLRRDKMNRLPMKAINKGVKTIIIDGKEEEAIMVYCSIDSKMREKYYNRNYYYRKSDGLFIRKEKPNGSIEELVSEK